jgi:hypothetical protein
VAFLANFRQIGIFLKIEKNILFRSSRLEIFYTPLFGPALSRYANS